MSLEVVSSTDTIDGSGGPLAIVYRADDKVSGLQFITAPSTQLQVANIKYPKGHTIKAHRHPPQTRTVTATAEVIVVMKGKIIVDLFDYDGNPNSSHILEEGDVIVLLGGGHGFGILKEGTILYEVKQGPFTPGADKEHYGVQV